MSSRTRSVDASARDYEHTWEFHHGTDPNIPAFYAHETQFTCPSYVKTYESITDTDRWSRKYIDDNDCEHMKVIRVKSELPFQFAYKGESNNPGSWYTVTSTDASWAYWALTQEWGPDGLTGISVSPPEDQASVLQGCIDSSIRTMLPAIRPRLSILNSIYELKDFKSIPKLLNKTRQGLLKLPNIYRGLRKSKRALRDITRLTASHYLNYQFNLRSLVSDICSLKRAYNTVGKQIKSLLDNEGKIRVRHYATSFPLFTELNQSLRIVPNETYTYDGHDLKRSVQILDPPMFRATMVYQYMLTDDQKSKADMYGYLDALGVQWNPAIVWNAIPWSFVVDWVVDVSRFLDQFKEGNLTPTTNILRYCWSVKGRRRIYNSVNYSVGSPQPSGDVVAITTDESFYWRRKHQPDWIQWFSTSGLNLKEFTYIGALLASH